jgi:predicted nicotinamide N-methyase
VTAAFVRQHTTVRAAPAVPEIVLHQADDAIGLWERTELAAGGAQLPPPFWAFAWAGGQAVARYLLDHPDVVRGKRVLDLAAGGGIASIAAALAGARAVTATDIDPAAIDALALNAAANNVVIVTICADVLDDPVPDVDVVTAGDVFYNRDLAAGMLAFLSRAAAAGASVLVGDPGRAYVPRADLVELAVYDIPTPHDLESAEIKPTRVWTPKRGRMAA